MQAAGYRCRHLVRNPAQKRPREEGEAGHEENDEESPEGDGRDPTTLELLRVEPPQLIKDIYEEGKATLRKHSSAPPPPPPLNFTYLLLGRTANTLPPHLEFEQNL